MNATGAYPADRASALSGVPLSTMHYWARNRVLVPSVSAKRVRLWSYTDLMALRIIYWLRQQKTSEAGVDIPRTSMAAIRRALDRLSALDLPVWGESRSSIVVDSEGDLHIVGRDGVETVAGQRLADDVVDLIAPFATREGTRGPDLVAPRASLRIVPGLLSGAPHIASTRLETRALRALEADGYSMDEILAFYPFVNEQQVTEALDLEHQLERNLEIDAAA